jgi:hypothetical protein
VLDQLDPDFNTSSASISYVTNAKQSKTGKVKTSVSKLKDADATATNVLTAPRLRHAVKVNPIVQLFNPAIDATRVDVGQEIHEGNLTAYQLRQMYGKRAKIQPSKEVYDQLRKQRDGWTDSKLMQEPIKKYSKRTWPQSQYRTPDSPNTIDWERSNKNPAWRTFVPNPKVSWA